MADIIPFKGTLYNQEKIKDLSKVIAPPYDVISPEEQDELYNSSPYNIVRILLGKDSPQDNEKENKYTRAAKFLKDWKERDILREDEEPSIYIYSQRFKVDGRTKDRIGFIALLRLEDFHTEASIHPHEDTFSGPKKDRLRLITSIEANLGPIFALFTDENKSIHNILMQAAETQPALDAVDRYGIENKLWRISGSDTVGEITRLMKAKKLFIADGHHRYEVGLAFSKLKKAAKYRYILTYFTDVYSDGIIILPVHRLIKGADKNAISTLLEELKRHFSIQDIASKERVKDFLSAAGSSEKRFVLYDGQAFTGLRSGERQALDVSVLHSLIIEPLKEKIEENQGKISIDFTKDMDYAVNEVDKGSFSLSIMLNPTKVTEVQDMAFSGRRMPQKSTYFYPKVLTGIVINVF